MLGCEGINMSGLVGMRMADYERMIYVRKDEDDKEG